MQLTIRTVVFALGALVFLAGLLAIAEGGPQGAAAGIWPLVVGAGMMIVTVVERTRYRSEAAERAHRDPGPGGGEDGTIEPRFQATQELFRDPTSGRLMRVWVDHMTGERRYRAEG